MRPLACLLLFTSVTACTPEPIAEDDGLTELFAVNDLADSWFPSAVPPPASPCGPQVAAFTRTATWSNAADAVAQAPAGSTVYLCAGVHAAPWTRTSGWPLTVAGVTGDPADVVVDATGAPYVFADVSDATLRLSGISFVGDVADTGVASLIYAYRSQIEVDRCIVSLRWTVLPTNPIVTNGSILLRVTDSEFYNINEEPIDFNSSTYDPDATLIVTGTTFRENHGGMSDALTVLHREPTSTLRFLIQDVVVEDNQGGQYPLLDLGAQNVRGLVRRTVVQNNFNAQTGGPAIFAHIVAHTDPALRGDGRLRIEDSSFLDNGGPNVASGIDVSGGAARGRHTAEVTIVRSEFLRNQADYGGGGGWTICPGTHGGRMHLQDVDFGVGADANTPADTCIYPYQVPLGNNVSGTLRYAP